MTRAWRRRARGAARGVYVRCGAGVLAFRLAVAWLAGNVLTRFQRRSRSLFAPRAVYATTRQWYETRGTTLHASYDMVSLDRSDHELPAPSAALTGTWDPAEFVRPPPPTFVARVPRARIFGAAGHVIANDGTLLADVSLLHPRYGFRNGELTRGPLEPPSDTIGRVCVLSVEWGHNYYHWLFDSLPRLAILRAKGVDLASVEAFVVNKTPLPFQTSVWAMLGVPPERIVESDHRLHLRADEAIVTSSLQETAHLQPWACTFLRDAFASDTARSNDDHPKRVYISRGDASVRRLVNEHACIEVLQAHGFVALSFGSMHITEQAEIMHNAEAVVAPHGAGLANVVFCARGTKVIELHSPTWPATNYWGLSHTLGLEYHAVMGRRASKRSPVANMLQLRDPGDFLVGVDDLVAALAAADLHSSGSVA